MIKIKIGDTIHVITKGTGLGLTGQSCRVGKVKELIYDARNILYGYRVEVGVMDGRKRTTRTAIVGPGRVFRD